MKGRFVNFSMSLTCYEQDEESIMQAATTEDALGNRRRPHDIAEAMLHLLHMSMAKYRIGHAGCEYKWHEPIEITHPIEHFFPREEKEGPIQ